MEIKQIFKTQSKLNDVKYFQEFQASIDHVKFIYKMKVAVKYFFKEGKRQNLIVLFLAADMHFR